MTSQKDMKAMVLLQGIYSKNMNRMLKVIKTHSY